MNKKIITLLLSILVLSMVGCSSENNMTTNNTNSKKSEIVNRFVSAGEDSYKIEQVHYFVYFDSKTKLDKYKELK